MKTTITFDPESNTFDFRAERPYLKADMRHATLWLRGDGFSPSETRRLLQHAMVLGALANLSLTIHS
jgi:hypothetical protein